MDKLLKSYLQSIVEITRQGDAREESYYPALKDLLEALAQAQGKTIQVTVLPKRTEAGSPDFRVWDGSHQVIGYIEAKAPGAKLEHVETSEQLRRYLHTFPNVILTDFYEFRLYRRGTLLEHALLARPFIAQTLKTKPPAEQVEALMRLFEAFFAFTLPPSLTPEALSVELARRTRFLRDQVIRPELECKQKDIYGFFDAFQKYLITGLTEEQFADLYAQTITYGLFAARTRAQGVFNRQMAHDLIPPTIGILRNVFRFISWGEPSPQMEAIVDDIAAVLSAADVQAILSQYYRQGKGDDPILHFYETFLAEYDPETRERRGVYYTPQPVVRYIVHAVHHLLKTRFGLTDGLADSQVTMLDPAAGTLTFPAEAVHLAFREFTEKYGEGAKETLLRDHILPHFYAFELLMAPYAIGHMKIGFLLEALGVPLQNGERFQFYLTNTLEMEDLQQITIPGLSSLSEESHHAAKVKKDEPILVILGNPPYSGLSANQNEWTESLLKQDLDGAQSYYTVDGKPLGEKNPKWLQDDYVKFLRFAQWKIHKAGRGIVAMITNHGYLDNPTFRGMRQSLMKTFDEIYILDLHGNSLKRETAPDGGPDENVFDIRQGVAIALLVKYSAQHEERTYTNHWQTPARVWHSLKPTVREMRKHPTPAEEALWHRLRGEQLGIKFRRQHSIDRFIVDFYAREPRLIIEVDGPIHETQKEYDSLRQSMLEELGYRVLRFTNDQVLQNIEQVIATIRAALAPSPQARQGGPLPLAPSPQARQGGPLPLAPSPRARQGGPLPLAPSPQARQGNAPSTVAGRGLGGGVYHAHLYGPRAQKYAWLEAHDLTNTPWEPLAPQSPYYFFIPRQTENLQAYQSWPQITEIFPTNSVGIVTARDNLTIRWTPEEMWTTVLTFSQLSEELAREAFQLGKDARDWKVSLAQQDVKRDGGPHREKIVPILYRPFDVRYTYYTGRSRGFQCMPRFEVMSHMLAGDNLALITHKREELDVAWAHVLVTNLITEHGVISSKTTNYHFPLYLYPSTESPDMFHRERKPNLASWLLPKLAAAYGFTPAPEEVLAYIYAVFYSPIYRQKYAQELRTDFPRVPFAAEGDLFRQMVGLGQRLIALHLLDSPELDPPVVKYQGRGEDKIERVRYEPATQRVYINADRYFEGIAPEMWEYPIGGYQVLEKYLKDRKGRRMDDPVRYIRIATAIARTLDIQQQIDEIYPQVEHNPLGLMAE